MKQNSVLVGFGIFAIGIVVWFFPWALFWVITPAGPLMSIWNILAPRTNHVMDAVTFAASKPPVQWDRYIFAAMNGALYLLGWQLFRRARQGSRWAAVALVGGMAALCLVGIVFSALDWFSSGMDRGPGD